MWGNAALVLLFIALIAGGVWWWSRASVLRARRSLRRHIADKVLGYARALEGHQLWVAMPFPRLELDPSVPTEDWSERPRRWVRVLSAAERDLVLADQTSTPAFGCHWYVYATEQGEALDFFELGTNLPEGIDPESIFPRDVEFAAK